MIKHKPVHERPINGGEQRVYRFANGYGASVVRGPFSYGGLDGLWELAVLKFHGPTPEDFDLTYDTPVTSDVLGSLAPEFVEKALDQIAALPSADEETS